MRTGARGGRMGGWADPGGASRSLEDLLNEEHRPELDRLATLASRLLDGAVAMVSIVHLDHQHVAGSAGLGEPWFSNRRLPRAHSLCATVAEDGGVLAVTEARSDPRVPEDLDVGPLGLVAYLGAALRPAGGELNGAFCVIDTKPREWSPADVAVIEDLAAAAEGLLTTPGDDRAEGAEGKRSTAAHGRGPAQRHRFDKDRRRSVEELRQANERLTEALSQAQSNEARYRALVNRIPDTVAGVIDRSYRIALATGAGIPRRAHVR
jgi:hypothetical protein